MSKVYVDSECDRTESCPLVIWNMKINTVHEITIVFLCSILSDLVQCIRYNLVSYCSTAAPPSSLINASGSTLGRPHVVRTATRGRGGIYNTNWIVVSLWSIHKNRQKEQWKQVFSCLEPFRVNQKQFVIAECTKLQVNFINARTVCFPLWMLYYNQGRKKFPLRLVQC